VDEPRESSHGILPTLEPGPAPALEPAPRGRPGPGLSAGEGSWWLRVAVEVLLISIGVFLALMGDQWRQSAHDRALALESLRRFRAEIQTNQQAVATVSDYHVGLLRSLQQYLEAKPEARASVNVRIEGLQPVFFEDTAWNLALATQSLGHIDQEIAYGLSRAYGLQRAYGEMTRGIMQAIYLRPIVENYEGLRAYYGDIVIWEPQLLRMYDELLPRIDRALSQ
jgi:hypothetical protein